MEICYIMNKEETLSNLKAYLDGDTAIGNIIPLRSVLESAIKYLSEPSLPSDLDEAAFTYENELWESGYKNCGYSPQEVNDAFKAGAEWMAGQGVSMIINDDTEWSEVDSFIHKNVDGDSIIQIRIK